MFAAVTQATRNRPRQSVPEPMLSAPVSGPDLRLGWAGEPKRVQGSGVRRRGPRGVALQAAAPRSRRRSRRSWPGPRSCRTRPRWTASWFVWEEGRLAFERPQKRGRGPGAGSRGRPAGARRRGRGRRCGRSRRGDACCRTRHPSAFHPCRPGGGRRPDRRRMRHRPAQSNTREPPAHTVDAAPVRRTRRYRPSRRGLGVLPAALVTEGQAVATADR
jgi:hypothetical protein